MKPNLALVGLLLSLSSSYSIQREIYQKRGFSLGGLFELFGAKGAAAKAAEAAKVAEAGKMAEAAKAAEVAGAVKAVPKEMAPIEAAPKVAPIEAPKEASIEAPKVASIEAPKEAPKEVAAPHEAKPSPAQEAAPVPTEKPKLTTLYDKDGNGVRTMKIANTKIQKVADIANGVGMVMMVPMFLPLLDGHGKTTGYLTLMVQTSISNACQIGGALPGYYSSDVIASASAACVAAGKTVLPQQMVTVTVEPSASPAADLLGFVPISTVTVTSSLV